MMFTPRAGHPLSADERSDLTTLLIEAYHSGGVEMNFMRDES